ncbi:hypothetical protein CP985_03195 [Malaciobacter mytili LMG 24559]|uniref:Uncharacterized protein n=1 Tax=Malaciobacter mytili LMG 24559 TaxID=1032238 RepID=A0AAX2AII3_9BACT|nr:hypothetical protein [Malaciobacter mytili]AXH16364.1 hypothetical protein AMYT_a0064 [Malaciobacter mytili LMG 24559]RXK16430.1 hypothetical protein CP985_03195 [Malaciobacter mytili LMG 24559]
MATVPQFIKEVALELELSAETAFIKNDKYVHIYYDTEKEGFIYNIYPFNQELIFDKDGKIKPQHIIKSNFCKTDEFVTVENAYFNA